MTGHYRALLNYQMRLKKTQPYSIEHCGCYIYAQSIGLGTVRAIAIADPGMLGDAIAGGSAPYVDSMLMEVGGAPGVEFRPSDIDVEASVDARFVAS